MNASPREHPLTETADRLAASRNRRTAKAPSRGKGLKVKRVFTTAGVHPYDEVVWERPRQLLPGLDGAERIPERQRSDVEGELRSSITDAS